MTEQAKLPDGSVDIVKNVRELETFLDKLLQHHGYRDADGNLEVFTDGEIESLENGVPSAWTDDEDMLLSPYDGYTFDCNFFDWLEEQLWHEVVYTRDGVDPVYKVAGWDIDITVGGPSVGLTLDPFTGKVTYEHSWGVVSWADPTGHFSPRTTIEFSPTIGEQITDCFKELADHS